MFLYFLLILYVPRLTSTIKEIKQSMKVKGKIKLKIKTLPFEMMQVNNGQQMEQEPLRQAGKQLSLSALLPTLIP